jgi:5-enolpyruvylshikimate-3-phosphate synthase
MVARYGKAMIPKPGGDKIGRRRLDTHFLGIQKLGASFNYDAVNGVFKITASHLKGTYMLLDEASVTGTANIIMAAVLAEGKTTIYNAACEPYLQQLCKMLNSMGAKITGIASNLLTIEGVKSLKGCTHHVLPDMIEVGSFIGMAAMTSSEVTIKNVSYENLGIIESDGDDIKQMQRLSSIIIDLAITIYSTQNPEAGAVLNQMRREIKALADMLLELNHDDRLFTGSFAYRNAEIAELLKDTTYIEFSKNHKNPTSLGGFDYTLNFRLLR